MSLAFTCGNLQRLIQTKEEVESSELLKIIQSQNVVNSDATAALMFWFITAYNMLEKIGMPVASLKKISVAIRPAYKNMQGCCIKQGNKYRIEVTDDTLKHPYPYIMSVILHELLHTCKDNDYSNNGGHDLNFLLRAQIIHEKYGVTVFCDDDGAEFAGLPILHVLECPCCGKIKVFKDPDEEAWNQYMENKDKGIHMRCRYCGAEYTPLNKEKLAGKVEALI